ncbi:hypothetical protein QTP88_012238 [Uroleucon formosanum]
MNNTINTIGIVKYYKIQLYEGGGGSIINIYAPFLIKYYRNQFCLLIRENANLCIKIYWKSIKKILVEHMGKYKS